MRITPINDAEAVIEPFWDPRLSELDQWAVEPGTGHGLRVFQQWCWLGFEWARRPAHGPALRLRRTCDLDCADYDRLVLSVMAPEKAVEDVPALPTDSVPLPRIIWWLNASVTSASEVTM